MRMLKFLRFMFATAAMVFVSGCLICLPLLYDPTYDPGPLVSSLRVPERIESISDMPRDRTVISGGVVLESGRRSAADIKELFEIKKGAEYAPSTTYRFTLQYSEETAKRGFDSIRDVPFVPSYFTGRSGDRAYAILYTMRDQREMQDSGDFANHRLFTIPWRSSDSEIY